MHFKSVIFLVISCGFLLVENISIYNPFEKYVQSSMSKSDNADLESRLKEKLAIRNPNHHHHHHKDYDFIIVGAGPAGCVLANRLSENEKHHVLLVEAGHFETMAMQIPMAVNYMQNSPYFWKYRTTSQDDVCLGFNDRRCSVAAGKGVGGGTLVDYMIYSRGNKHDYNRWAAQGMEDWSWKDVLPYFKKSEQIAIKSLETSDNHGKNGPVNIEYAPYRTKIASAFMEASKAMGQEEIDYNSGKQIGTSYPQLFTKNGHRHSAFKAFIKPILHRKNLDIMIRTEAIKILLDNDLKATGILARRESEEFTLNAKKEVIITAGALNSPKLLMASGIGPDHVLKKAGIKQVHSLPVGQNLLDQVVYYGPVFKLDSTGSSLSMDDITLKSLHDFKHGKGPLTVPGGIEALSFVRLRRQYAGHQSGIGEEAPNENILQSDEFVAEENNGWKNKSHIEEKLDYSVLADKYWKHHRKNIPDIEVVLNSAGFHGDRGYGMRKGIGMTDEIYNEVYKPLEQYEHDTFLAKIILLRPKSRGYLTMGGHHHDHEEDRHGNNEDDDDDDDHDDHEDEHHTSKDPLRIHANYLENRKDIDLILRGIKYVIRLSETHAFKRLGARLHSKKLPQCEKYDFESDDYWKCSIEVLTTSALHQMGTCKMGHKNDENSVVTTKLKVRGVKHLRVADNSIIPIPIGAHAVATAYMIGEKAADIINDSWVGKNAEVSEDQDLD